MTRLRAMIHPFILRRLKKDVLKDLPEKQEEIVTVALSGEQKKALSGTFTEIENVS